MAEVILDIEDITFSIDEESYCWTFNGTLVDMASWVLCEAGNTVTINLGVDQYICLIDSRNMTQEFNQNVYSFSGRSLTSILGEGATPIHNTWDATTTHAIIDELAVSTTDIAIPSPDIRITNWNLPEGLFVSEGETPIALIKKISTAIGGIIYTEGDGTLVIAPKHKTPPPLYDINTVDFSVSDLDDIFTLTESREVKPGYNQVEVTDEPESDGSVISIEQISMDTINLIAHLRVTIFPFVPSIILLTSHNSISIVTSDPIEEELTEVIEIIDGAGSVSRPVLELVSIDWQDVDLGTLNPNGTALSSEIPGTSLVSITYITQYHDCTVTAQDSEQVQVYMEDV